MPEGTVTEVFRADLDVNLKAKEALAELDQLNSRIKKAVAEMQSSLDSLQFKSPFRTWQSEIQNIARELAALTMPRAMRFDIPEKEMERYVARLKEAAQATGMTMEEIKRYLIENAANFTLYSRAGEEAFIQSVLRLKSKVVGNSIIPEMVARIRNVLQGLTTALGGAVYGPFRRIVDWARNMSTDTKAQVAGMVMGITDSLHKMATETQQATAMTTEAAERMLFGTQTSFRGLMGVSIDVAQAFRLITAEGGNVAIGLEMLSRSAGGLVERFGGSSAAARGFVNANRALQSVLSSVGNAILNIRRTMKGHDWILGDLARSTGTLTESLRLQMDVWRKSAVVIKASQSDLGVYVDAVVKRLSTSLWQLDTSLKHVATSFLATGKISKERMQDATEAVRDLVVNMENAKKLGVPLHPQFEARMKEATHRTRLFAAEAQRLAAAQEKRAGAQRKVADAARQTNMQTRQIVSYLRPGGPMATGLTSTTMMLRNTSAGMQRFSLSMGSVMSVAAGIGGVLGQLSPAFSAVIVGVAQMADRFIASIAAMQAAAATGKDRIKAAMSALGAILTGFGVSALGIIVSTGKLAAEVETLWITLKVTAENVGISVPIITEKLEDLKNAGITTREAMNSLVQFLRAKLPLDQLDALADAAKNVAVTLPAMTSSEAMQRFVWIIQSGNSALLHGLGIQKTVNDMVIEYAKEMGIATSAVKGRVKQEAIIAGLIKEVASFQGVYNEAMKTASKMLGSMVRYWEELRLKIGEEFLPIVTKIVFAFAKLLKSLNDMPPRTLKLITAIVAVVGVLGTFLGVLLLLAPGIAALTGLIGGLAGVIGSVVTAIGGFLVAAITSVGGFITLVTTIGGTIPIIGGLIAIIYKAIQGFRDIYTPLEGVEGLLYRLKVALKPLIATWRYFWDEIVAVRWVRIEEGIDKIADRLRGFASENEEVIALVERAWTVAKDFVWALVQVIDQLLAAFGDLLNYDYEGMWEHFQDAAAMALGWVAELFADFILAAYGWGVNMVSHLALGLIDAAKTAIPVAAEYVGGMLALFLEGHSPPIKGPLKRIRMWGRGVSEAFGAGVGDVNITGHMITIGQQFSALRGKAKDWGRNLTGTFAEGISARAAEAIAPAMEVVGREIARFLEGASAPEAGRLVELQDWGKSAMEAFMEGFSMADFGVFDQALSMIETRLKQLIGTGKEQAAELGAVMLDMRARVAEAIATMGAGAAVDVSNLANSIFQNVAVPVTDILQVAQATLQAQTMKEVITAIRAEIAAAKASRRKAIEAIQDVIYAFQEEIAVLNEHKEALKAKIEEEVKARLEMMGLVIDPAVMKRLQAALRRASLQVKRQEAELQKFTAYRERLGIDMLSWEEVSLMASLDLAKQKQTEAQIAVDEEQDRIARAKELADEIEAQYAAEFEAIEERIKQTQNAIKAQQKLLRQAQRADKEATRAEQERLRAAQEYAAMLVARAALLRKRLQERLKSEELLAKLQEEGNEELEKEIDRRKAMIAGWREAAKARMKKLMEAGKEGIPLEPSEGLKTHIERLRELLAGGPRAILGAIAQAVYNIAKVVLGKFGIDLDEMLRKARLKWEGIKEWFAGVREKWEEALGAAETLLQPWFDIFDTLKEKWEMAIDILRPVFDDLWESIKETAAAVIDLFIGPEVRESWLDLGSAFLEAIGAVKDLYDRMDDFLDKVREAVLGLGEWRSGFLVFIGPLLLAIQTIYAFVVSAKVWMGILEGARAVIDRLKEAALAGREIVEGFLNVFTGILTLDPSKIAEGIEKIISGFHENLEALFWIGPEFLEGFIEGILKALGLGAIVDAYEEFKDNIAKKLDEIKKTILGVFVGIGEVMMEEISKAFPIQPLIDIITGAWQELMDVIGGPQLIESLDGLKGAWDGLKDTFGKLVVMVQEEFGEAWEDLQKALKGLKKVLAPLTKALSKLWKDMKPLITAIKDLIIKTGLWKGILVLLAPLYIVLKVGIAILTGIIKAFTRGVEGAIDIIEGMVRALTGTIEVITGILELDLDKIGEGFRKIFEGNIQVIESFIMTAYESMGAFVEGALRALGLSDIVDAFIDLKDQVIERVGDLVNSIIGWFKNLWRDLIGGSIVRDIVDDITEAFDDLVASAYGWGYELLSRFLWGINAMWTSFSDWIGSIITRIAEIWVLVRDNANSWGYNLLNKFINGLNTIWSTFSDWIDSIITRITKIWVLVRDNAKNWGYNLLNRMLWGFNEIWDNFSDWIGDIIGKLGSINIASEALDWGKNLINNLVDGIRDAYHSGLIPLITTIADWLRRILGFGSAPEMGPLSGAEEWGPNMMRMLAKGIHDNSGLVFAEVAALASGLSAGLNVGITPPGISLAPITVSYAPVLNFYGPVSPEEVKQAVIEAPSEIDWKGMIRR